MRSCALGKLTILVFALVYFGVASVALPSRADNYTHQLRILTWNIRTLSEPHKVFDDQVLRSRDQLTELANFAASLKADIVALQEVGSLSALATVFPISDYLLCISGQFFERHPELKLPYQGKCFSSEPLPETPTSAGYAWQFTAFAIRRRAGAVASIEDFAQVGVLHRDLADGTERPTRWALKLRYSLRGHDVDLLNVHLKSNCRGHVWKKRKFDPHCKTLSKQADKLKSLRDRLHPNHVVLGDFNRPMDEGDAFGNWLIGTSLKASKLVPANQAVCSLAEANGYTAKFDHFLVSQNALQNASRSRLINPKISREITEYDKVTFGDHCPYAFELRWP